MWEFEKSRAHTLRINHFTSDARWREITFTRNFLPAAFFPSKTSLKFATLQAEPFLTVHIDKIKQKEKKESTARGGIHLQISIRNEQGITLGTISTQAESL